MTDTTPYREHVAKIGNLMRRREQPFDEGVLQRAQTIAEVFDVLGGTMTIPAEVEADIWMSIVSFVMQQGGAGVRIQNEEWSVLDMVLAAATQYDKFPVLMLAELMLSMGHNIVELRGRPVHAAQLYEASYSEWSRIPDPKDRARYHFKFGFLLLSIDELPPAVEQLKFALECDPSSGASDLLLGLFDKKGDPLPLPNSRSLRKAEVDHSKPRLKRPMPHSEPESNSWYSKLFRAAIAFSVVAAALTVVNLALRRRKQQR